MRTLTHTLLLLGMTGLCAGCISELLEPDTPVNVVVPQGAAIDTIGRQRIAGVYRVVEGSDDLGDTLVAIWVRDRLTFHAGLQVMFCELGGAISGDTARFNGYYRFVRSAVSGHMSLSATPAEGGSSLAGSVTTSPITLRGTYQHPKSEEATSVVLSRVRDITPATRPFYIIGHAGGGRNSERLGRSENSIECARFAEYLGCNAVEIDLRTTSDGEVILMHDGTFSSRTVLSTYILGDVHRFTLQQIRNNARLVHGEQIPTLVEFLTTIVDSTDLQLIWLDVKVATGVDKMLRAQKDAMVRAQAQVISRGRPALKVLFGVTTQEILDAYRRSPLADSTPVLCELTRDIVTSLPSCEAWCPRWTEGLQSDAVQQMQALNINTFPWTIDSPDYIVKFLDQRQSPYAGILTNYPSMLAGLYHLRTDK